MCTYIPSTQLREEDGKFKLSLVYMEPVWKAKGLWM